MVVAVVVVALVADVIDLPHLKIKNRQLIFESVAGFSVI
jgi:hypothetical protein